MSEFTVEERLADLEKAVVELAALVEEMRKRQPTLQEQSEAWKPSGGWKLK